MLAQITQANPSSTIISINPKSISKRDLVDIVEIEQDMWARNEGVGEYVKCKCCGKILSKEDVFGHIDRKLKIKTVAEIERILGGRPNCIHCHSETEAIYDRNEYIEEVRERYRESVDSFITVYMVEGKIRGFIDGYIADFGKIYKREFNHNYGEIGEKALKEIIEKKLGYKVPDEIFMVGVMGMEEGYKSFVQLFNLMKGFLENLNRRELLNLFLLIDVIVGSNVHGIHNSVGATRVGVKEVFPSLNFPGRECDIFYQPDFVNAYGEKFSLPPKEFIRAHGAKMKVA